MIIGNKTGLSIFYKYFFSYILILLIPLSITGILLYKNIVIDSVNEIETSSLIKLERIKEVVDLQINQLNEITIKIANNKKLSKFMLESSDYSASEGISELNNYLLNSNLIDEIFLYYRGDESVYSTKGKYTIDVLINRAYRFHKWSYSQFYNDINTITKKTIKKSEKVNVSDKEEKDIVTFLFPISPYLKNPRATTIFLIRKTAIEDLINSVINESEASVYIFNENSEILFPAINKNYFEKEAFPDILRDSLQNGINKIQIADAKYYIINTSSDITSWTYSMVMPSEKFLYSVYYNKTMVLRMLVIILFIGIVIITLLAINNYKPIRRLSMDIGKFSSKEIINYKTNEFDFIKNIVTETIDTNRKLISQMEEHLDFVKEQGITMLLRGEVYIEFVKSDLIDYIKQKLFGPYFCVMVVEIDQSEIDYYIANESDSFLNIIKRHKFFSDAYATRLIGEKVAVFVFNLSEDDNGKHERYIIAEKLQNFFKEQFQTVVTIGVSKTCKSIFELSKLYNEAQAALEYKFLRGRGKIIIIEDLLVRKQDCYWFPIEQKALLVNALKQGNISNYILIVNDIAEEIERKDLSLPIIKSICFDIINVILKTINEINIEGTQKFTEDIINFGTINELKIKLNKIGGLVCNHIKHNKESGNEELRDNLIRYIKDNYKDNNLSLEHVANEFKISPIYLSRFFKDQTGQNFIDYVRNLRLEETKRLLLITKKSVKDIVKDVGYIDVSSFMKLFKSNEGITPGEYRKLYSQRSKCQG